MPEPIESWLSDFGALTSLFGGIDNPNSVSIDQVKNAHINSWTGNNFATALHIDGSGNDAFYVFKDADHFLDQLTNFRYAIFIPLAIVAGVLWMYHIVSACLYPGASFFNIVHLVRRLHNPDHGDVVDNYDAVARIHNQRGEARRVKEGQDGKMSLKKAKKFLKRHDHHGDSFIRAVRVERYMYLIMGALLALSMVVVLFLFLFLNADMYKMVRTLNVHATMTMLSIIAMLMVGIAIMTSGLRPYMVKDKTGTAHPFSDEATASFSATRWVRVPLPNLLRQLTHLMFLIPAAVILYEGVMLNGTHRSLFVTSGIMFVMAALTFNISQAIVHMFMGGDQHPFGFNLVYETNNEDRYLRSWGASAHWFFVMFGSVLVLPPHNQIVLAALHLNDGDTWYSGLLVFVMVVMGLFMFMLLIYACVMMVRACSRAACCVGCCTPVKRRRSRKKSSRGKHDGGTSEYDDKSSSSSGSDFDDE